MYASQVLDLADLEGQHDRAGLALAGEETRRSFAQREGQVVGVRADARVPPLPVAREAPPEGCAQTSGQVVLSPQRRLRAQIVRVAPRSLVGEFQRRFPARHLG